MKNKLINNKRKNAGFTLLELVVVVAVMGLISTMAMDVYSDHSNQKRFDATKARLAEIKFAIMGDPMMRVGSQAVMTGFFNDMERLPRNLNELIIANTKAFCQHNTNYYIDTSKNQAQCGVDPNFTWHLDDSANWKGPYLHNIQAINNTQVFGDAWGNLNPLAPDLDNFGWNFTPTDSGLSVQSFGLDRTTAGTNLYEQDYPSAPDLNLINKTELDRMMQLKALIPSAGYCVIIAAGTIDLNFVSQASCEANNPAVPAPPAVPPDPTHLWAIFL